MKRRIIGERDGRRDTFFYQRQSNLTNSGGKIRIDMDRNRPSSPLFIFHGKMYLLYVLNMSQSIEQSKFPTFLFGKKRKESPGGTRGRRRDG